MILCLDQRTNPAGKNNTGGVIFVQSAFNIQCHIIQNTLLHTAFSAILPAGDILIKAARPSRHMTLERRCMDVETTSKR